MVTLTTDVELLRRWREGDAKAGNELFRRHFHSLYRFFRDKTTGGADDLIQATFLACVRARDQFRGDSSFRTYLFTVARHQLYRHIRAHARAPELDFAHTSLLDIATSPSVVLERDQRRAQLLQALRRLPLEQQLLLELYYWEDVPPRELATVFEIPGSTARTWLQRAREALRAALEAEARSPSTAWSDADLDAWARDLRAREEGDDD